MEFVRLNVHARMLQHVHRQQTTTLNEQHVQSVLYGKMILDGWHLGCVFPIELKFSENVDKGHKFSLLQFQTYRMIK